MCLAIFYQCTSITKLCSEACAFLFCSALLLVVLLEFSKCLLEQIKA